MEGGADTACSRERSELLCFALWLPPQLNGFRPSNKREKNLPHPPSVPDAMYCPQVTRRPADTLFFCPTSPTMRMTMGSRKSAGDVPVMCRMAASVRPAHNGHSYDVATSDPRACTPASASTSSGRRRRLIAPPKPMLISGALRAEPCVIHFTFRVVSSPPLSLSPPFPASFCAGRWRTARKRRSCSRCF